MGCCRRPCSGYIYSLVVNCWPQIIKYWRAATITVRMMKNKDTYARINCLCAQSRRTGPNANRYKCMPISHLIRSTHYLFLFRHSDISLSLPRMWPLEYSSAVEGTPFQELFSRDRIVQLPDVACFARRIKVPYSIMCIHTESDSRPRIQESSLKGSSLTSVS